MIEFVTSEKMNLFQGPSSKCFILPRKKSDIASTYGIKVLVTRELLVQLFWRWWVITCYLFAQVFELYRNTLVAEAPVSELDMNTLVIKYLSA